MTTKIWQLTALGQSLWYDNIERRLLENGELAAMISRGDIRGLTSNPTIFNNAIAKSTYYDSALIPMAWSGYTDQMILEQLMIEDIKRTADLLRSLYETTHGSDGFVSLEVNPGLANEAEKTSAEAQRLWGLVDRSNLMIKIPATKPGLKAIRRSIAAGLNVNITLIFSIERYKEVMEAYLAGLEDRMKAGKPINQINSVASFFVSRIDSKVDKYLEAVVKNTPRKVKKARSLMGKIAIANARLAYQEFRKVFEGTRFKRLEEKGARLQRPLWASTSTKNPAYHDTMYVDELIGAYTVNTVPPQTLDAFIDHGSVEANIEKDLVQADKDFADLEALGISMEKVTQELEKEGVKAFADSFNSLIETIRQRKKDAVAQLVLLAKPVATRVAQMQADIFAQRFYAKDPALWTDDPKGQEEVRIRLGWLTLPETSQALVPELEKFAGEVKTAGFTHALLLGMGGSSLAPEVISLIYGDSITGLKLSILDSTDPAQVRQAEKRNPLKTTLFIVSSKSGGTAEVNAMFSYFWHRAQLSIGEKAGEHFIAITDPSTSLEKLAFERNFRKIFLANSNVGGRYSALGVFGLVPAALMGINVQELLNCAAWMATESTPDQPTGRNPGFVLGAVLAEAFNHGKDKLTLVADKELEPFGAWLEQLVAESSGKSGKGIIPIHGEPVAIPTDYAPDRLFYYLRRDGKYDTKLQRLRKAGHPVLTQQLNENSAIASEFLKWEIAIATACSIMKVNAFDQPDVQDSKNRTVAKISYYQSHRKFNEGKPALEEKGMALFGQVHPDGKRLTTIVVNYLKTGQPNDYVAINAFLPRDRKTEAALQKLRSWIRAKTGLATTVGFGPRYLHSTGQLHKGGANNGLFIILTANPVEDLEIPKDSLSFGNLERGQALGDLEALETRDRRLLRIHFDSPELLVPWVSKLVD
jgi:transaldolase / glucose-6-phosphate isomerase